MPRRLRGILGGRRKADRYAGFSIAVKVKVRPAVLSVPEPVPVCGFNVATKLSGPDVELKVIVTP
jgi:hypothetical protein